MPPYWDNKDLPASTLILPDIYFQLFDYFLNFYIKRPFQCNMRFEKGAKKFGNRGVLTRSRQKACALPSMLLKQMLNGRLFCVDYPNHTLWAELVLIASANKVGYLHLV